MNLGAAFAQTAPPSDVVVMGGKQNRPEGIDALFRRFCFDPMRRTKRFVPPAAEPPWRPLDADERRRFSIVDDAMPAYARDGLDGNVADYLKIERFVRENAIVENRCTLVSIGTAPDRALPGRFSAIFGAVERGVTSVQPKAASR